MHTDLFDRLSEPYTAIDREHYLCVGRAADCQVFVDDGAAEARWSRQPDLDPRTLALRLMPTYKQMQAAKFRLPKALGGCSRLDFLQLPLALLTRLQPGDLPQSLRKLMVINTEGPLPDGRIDWDMLGDTSIDSLILYDDADSPDCKAALEGIEALLPRLRYLSFDRRRHGDLASYAPDLEVLLVSGGGNGEWLEDAPAGLRALALLGMGLDFDTALLRPFANLEALLLNGIRSIVDADVLADLGALRELQILNSRKWNRPDRIAELPLNSLMVLDCGRPFRGFRHLFDDARYEKFDIDFS
ncbi:hypothetical protein [Saccharibacillus alkalitolerans]|uniref:Leucine-rich repeat domain-containing protein n=1 Tax=Saccharibacillus alkalitolerans TaxID=2705290 RepID=A0ABX0F947_9BACL|nr:hypothetical protein [Saccharibacillus alkalitolerans]NGZ76494.1 hypothetical protein [Saccharibacillus alkalitolerans]